MIAADWGRIERIVAVLTLIGAVLGLAVGLFTGPHLLPLALLGLLSSGLAWRGRLTGHAAGVVFYAFQLAGYHSYDLTTVYPLRGALSLAFVVHLPAGVLIVNAFAAALFMASVRLLWRRRPTTRTSRS